MKAHAIMAFVVLLALSSCAKGAKATDADGSFEATEIIVSAEASGRILSFEAEEGSRLAAGQVVGNIDSAQLVLRRKQLLASKSAVESRHSDADLQLASIRQQIESARKERERVQKLLVADAANQKQLDDLDAQVLSLEKQEAAQRTNISQSNEGVRGESSSLDLQVAQLDDLIEKCSIASPIDGTVLLSYAERGEYATQGKALFKIADMENMDLRAYIASGELERIKLGQEVTVIADFGSKEERKYRGTVSWISDKAEFTPKTAQTRDERASLVYAMKVAVKNDGYLKIGMYGKVRLGD